MQTRFLPVMLLAALACSAPAFAAIDAPQYAPGDTWSFRKVDGYNHETQGTYTHTVSAVAAGGISVERRSSDGKLLDTVTLAAPGLLSAGRLNARARGSLEPALQLLPFPLEEGKRWRQSVARVDPAAYGKREVKVYGRVQGWEMVKVPAGEFRALKIVRELFLGDEDSFRGQTKLTQHLWYVPELRNLVKVQNWEEYHEDKRDVVGPYYQGTREIFELVTHRVSSK